MRQSHFMLSEGALGGVAGVVGWGRVLGGFVVGSLGNTAAGSATFGGATGFGFGVRFGDFGGGGGVEKSMVASSSGGVGGGFRGVVPGTGTSPRSSITACMASLKSAMVAYRFSFFNCRAFIITASISAEIAGFNSDGGFRTSSTRPMASMGISPVRQWYMVAARAYTSRAGENEAAPLSKYCSMGA